MQANSIPKNIQALVEKFTLDLIEASRTNLVAVLSSQLGVSISAGSIKPTTTKTVSIPGTPARPGRMERRSSETIDALKAQVVSHVRKHVNGSRVEEISVGLGISTKELKLPIIALLDEHKLTKKGQKRATRYYVPKGR